MRSFQPRPVMQIQKPKISTATVLEKRINKPRVAKPVVYSSEEVRQMNNYELCREFICVTGLTCLSCKHCGRDAEDREKGVQRHIYPYFMIAIRRRAEKEGLHREMKMPKSCDAVVKRNDVCNPINNPAYYIIHHASSNSTEIAAAIEKRQEGIQAIGIVTRPYVYD